MQDSAIKYALLVSGYRQKFNVPWLSPEKVRLFLFWMFLYMSRNRCGACLESTLVLVENKLFYQWPFKEKKSRKIDYIK